MPWTDDFKNALNATIYHPRFRLTIGTTEVAGTAVSDIWENNKAVQIFSHNQQVGYSKSSSTSDFASVENGIVTVSMGARSVTPRTLVAQHAQCTVTVTNEAATIANRCKEGTLCKLECDVNGSGWNCIFIGMLKNIRWSGGATSQIQMVDALNSLKVRAGETNATRKNRESDFMWFKNIGETSKLATPFTGSSGTGGLVLASAGLGAAGRADYKGLEKNFRSFQAYTPRPADLVFKHIADGGNGGQFAVVTPTGSVTGDVICEYGTLIIEPESAGSTGTATINAPTTDPKLGYFQRTGGSLGDREFGTGATVKSALLIHGDPIAELVNCFYQNGYGSEMVYGLFGSPTNAAASEYINWSDIGMKHAVWRSIWDRFTTGNAPLRTVVTSTMRDGFTYLSKIFAKFGVFPTWKNGAYSVGCILHQGEQYTAGYSGAIIPFSSIVNMSWEKNDNQTKAVYNAIDAKVTDKDSYTLGSHGFSVDASPIIPLMEVKVNECCVSQTSADRFYTFYREAIFNPWFTGTTPERATVTLNSMRYASLACGDLVAFQIDPINKLERPTGYQQEFNAIHKEVGTIFEHILDSATGTDTTLAGGAKFWTVVSVQTDWMKGQVTIECLWTWSGGASFA